MEQLNKDKKPTTSGEGGWSLFGDRDKKGKEKREPGGEETGGGGGYGLGQRTEDAGKGIKFVLPGFYNSKEKGKTTKQWLSKILIYLTFKHDSFQTKGGAMLWFLTQMEGIAGDWAQTKTEQIGKEGEDTSYTMETLVEEFKNYFNDPDTRRAAHCKLTALTMTGSAPEYILEFQNLQGYLKWNNRALVNQYHIGLSQQIRNVLLTQKEQPATLSEMIIEAPRIDGQLWENDTERNANKATTSSNKPKPSTSSTTLESKKPPLTESPNYVSKEIRA